MNILKNYILNGKKKMIFYNKEDTNMKEWFKAAGVRALKTVAQTAVATIGTSVVLSDVNWVMVASASVLAGILSLLTSIAGLPELKNQEEQKEIAE